MQNSKEYLGLYWSNRPLTLKEYLKSLNEILSSLNEVIGHATDFYFTSVPNKIRLENFDVVSLEKICNSLIDKDVAYKKLSLESDIYSPVGFVSSWELCFGTGLTLDITLNAGATRDNSCSLICTMNKAQSNDKELIFAVFCALVKSSKAHLAHYTSPKLLSIVDPNIEFNLSLGWITFIDKSITIESSFFTTSPFEYGTIICVDSEYIGVMDETLISSLKTNQMSLIEKNALIVLDDF